MSDDIISDLSTEQNEQSVVISDVKMFVVKQAAQVFTHVGYDGATIRGIADKCNMGDGSLYHYFKSKDDVLLAVIADLNHYCETKLFSLVRDENLHLNERIKSFINAMKLMFKERVEVSLLILWGSQLNNISDKFHEITCQHFKKWLNAFEEIFIPYCKEEANKMATHCFKKLIGSILMARILNDDHCVDVTCDELYLEWMQLIMLWQSRNFKNE